MAYIKIDLTAHDRIAATRLKSKPNELTEAQKIALASLDPDRCYFSAVVETSMATRRRIRTLNLACGSRVINGTHGPIVYLRTLNEHEFQAARQAVEGAVADFSGVGVRLSTTTLPVPPVKISWTRAARR